MATRSIEPSDWPALALHAARFQARPETATAYLSASQRAIAHELSDLAVPWVGAVIERAGEPQAWIVGELDADLGRVWWIGPFATDAFSADDVYHAAVAQLPPKISEQELAADQTNRLMAEFADRHGFAVDVASFALRRPRAAPLPASRSNARIAPLAGHEAPKVVELHDGAFPNGHYTGAGLLERTDCSIVTATIDETVVGYIAIEPQADKSMYIDFLAVDPRNRRRGVGHDLVVAGCLAADAQECESTHLTVRETLPGARQLYESVGFVTESTLVPYRLGFLIESEEHHPDRRTDSGDD